VGHVTGAAPVLGVSWRGDALDRKVAVSRGATVQLTSFDNHVRRCALLGAVCAR
jgi:hypothetical protein